LIQGHNQQIRKMFDAIHHSVSRLRRIAISHIKIEKMPLGAYRLLAPHEVKQFMRPIRKPVVKPQAVLKPRERVQPVQAKPQERIQPKERASSREGIQSKERMSETKRTPLRIRKPSR
jgi:23S rRNA pseudouridine2605 synthase